MSTSEDPPVVAVPSEPPSRDHAGAPAPLQHEEPAVNHPSTSIDASPAPDPALLLDTPQSQPMTASVSSSSQQPPVENGDGSNAGPYGTRSRNRTGGARPNYAEDKDLDLEIEALPKVSRASKRSSAANSEPQATSSGPAAAAAATATPADPIPENVAVRSASTPVPPAAPAPSKKRKQPGSHQTVSTTPASGNSRSKHTASIPFRGYVETNMMSFLKHGRKLNAKKQLVADDGTTVQANDHVYLVCEPPGEPYYLARIMEFLHTKNDPDNPIDSMRVNWYYRPKDILRRVQDTRVVFASMHSDTCPLTSLRGKCNIHHLSEIANMDEYRGQQDSFWFDKLFDRYMHRYYEVIPTPRVVNVPQHVKAVLDERWKFVLVEIGRGRELTSESKKCTKCEQFASNNDSVDCAVCKKTYHMQCVRPPLQKKPARGFAWACAACSRAQELRMDARNTPAGSDVAHGDDDDFMDDDDDDGPLPKDLDTRDSSAAPEPHPPPTPAQIAQANLWPWRYLGVHAHVEDALDYDDRIYPRASSRLGPRHQANVNVWHGRPVELVKPADIKRKYLKHQTKYDKKSKDTGTDTDRDQRLKRPKWVVDEPVGYIARGKDEPIEVKGKKEMTSQLIFKMPDPAHASDRGGDDDPSIPPADAEALVDDFMTRVKPIAAQYNLLDSSVDFLTKAVEKLQENSYNVDKALEAMKGLSLRADLKQPDLNREELKRFEEGVAKYGSELRDVARHVGVNKSRIVRFYYTWKKTEKGRQIWGNYDGRRSKKESKRTGKEGNTTKLLDDVADDQDDSAFDNEKAVQKKRGFECKFCGTQHSRQWRRAPATAPGALIPNDEAAKNGKDKSQWLTLALCGRCAYLWRRYALQYENIEEVSKKIASSGTRAAKRKVDEELLRLILEAHQMSGDPIATKAVDEVTKIGMEVPHNIIQPEEPPKKKGKTDKDAAPGLLEVPEKKKPVEKPQEPPPVEPDPPKVKIHPCAVCQVIDVPGQELLKCRDCRLHVHASCYGVSQKTNTKPWFCDMCRNDHNLQVSTTYECILCPVRNTPQELMEPLKATHKKKTDRDREKERIEKEIIQEASRRWRMEQEAAGRPVNPREALKRTAWNNWIHITCALWTREIKFGNADLLDDAEGVGFIPPDRFEPACKICKTAGLPTVKCHQSNCTNHFHVGCAHQMQYIFGFDVAPVKSSRRDAVSVMKLESETGIVTAAIWCPTHLPPTYVHNMLEPTETGLTAMQLFARTYKQVDNSVTGTVRRAAQFVANLPSSAPPVQPVAAGRGTATPNMTNGDGLGIVSLRSSPAAESPVNVDAPPVESAHVERPAKSSIQKKCRTCAVDVSPRWWPLLRTGEQLSATNESQGDKGKDHSAVNGARDAFMTNGIVRAEPPVPHRTGAPSDNPGVVHYQCHKCHILKRTPPPSPSQHQSWPRQHSDPPHEPFTYQPPPFAPAPPPVYPLARPAVEGPPPPAPPPPPPAPGLPSHSHPMGTAISHHSPWQSAPPPPPPAAAPLPPAPAPAPPTWTSPGARPPRHSPPPQVPAPYGQPLYRPSPTDYNQSPYGRASQSAQYPNIPPPPPPPPPPAPAPILQHSPPPAPYGHPSHHHHHHHHHHHPAAVSTAPLAGHPPSPPRYVPERAAIPPPHMGLGSSSLLSRSFAPDSSRQPNLGSPVNGYTTPHSPAARLYNQGPGPLPPAVMRQSPSSQSLAPIAQGSGEHGGPPHSRQASAEMAGTPRFTARPIPESPQARPITPAAGLSLRDEKRDGPGASASPSLRNLLS